MRDKLQKAIKDSGLKKTYIASKLAVTPNTLTCYISGRRNPKIDKAQKLAEILNCKIEDIFEENTNNTVK